MHFTLLLSTLFLAPLSASHPNPTPAATARSARAAPGAFVGNARQLSLYPTGRPIHQLRKIVHVGTEDSGVEGCANVQDVDGNPSTHFEWKAAYSCRFYRELDCKDHIGGPEGAGLQGAVFGTYVKIGDAENDTYRSVTCW
ncbi:hypothetical protein BDV95DRAFT_112387 [Massariosphaeria phaeospora]|uniref:AA1-like domain-containing protein n=1 Tax=Massariosphaeria phaeospora TaxID=100035 RepID=A0A7C8M5N2_9PLEO|nr:hypothetical protein BDV95DRAFT_112387 [Massariosphaeria phaeospora]